MKALPHQLAESWWGKASSMRIGAAYLLYDSRPIVLARDDLEEHLAVLLARTFGACGRSYGCALAEPSALDTLGCDASSDEC